MPPRAERCVGERVSKQRMYMKKAICTIVVALMMPLAVMADSYGSLWKQYELLQRKNQPRSAIRVLEQIAAKARADKAYGQLIKAQFGLMDAWEDLAPDSLGPQLQRLRGEALRAEKTDRAAAAIYYSVLGSRYRDRFGGNADSMEVADALLRKSMQEPALLAATKAENYEPLMIGGSDSQIFHNDLLHVLGFVTKDYRTLHRWYDAHGNRSAACYCALQLLKDERQDNVFESKKSKYLQRLDSLITCYGDLPVGGELGIARYEFMDLADDVSAEEKMNYLNYALAKWGTWPRMNILRNARSRLTLPSFLAECGPQVLLPHKERVVRIRQLTNIQSLTMSVTRLNTKVYCPLNPADKHDYAKIEKLLLAPTTTSVTHRYVGLPNYKVSSDSMTVGPLEKGVYLVEFTTDNKDIRPVRMLLHVSDMYVLESGLPNARMRLIAMSATTGQPVANAKIRIFSRTYQESKRSLKATLTVDRQGEVSYKRSKEEYDVYCQVFTAADDFCPPCSSTSYYAPGNDYGKEDEEDFITRQVQLFTDRSLYRPGQQVHVSMVDFTVNDRTKKASVNANDSIALTLYDADYKETETKKVRTDEYGTASVVFDLPKSGKTGLFTIEANDDFETSFHVEEYKRPTFTVDFTPYKKSYKNGDTISVEGTAKSYAGVPVQGAKVVCSVVRRPNWFWWRGSDESRVTVKEDTLMTDEAGRFVIRVPLHLPEGKNNLPRYYTYDISATVTDGAGESHEGTIALPFGNRSVYFNCNLPERINRDSLTRFTFIYKNLAGENVAAKVYYKVDDAPYQANSNEEVSLDYPRLKSGHHILEAVCGEDTLRRSFVLFSLKDKKPAENTPDWCYTTSNQFGNDGKPVYVQLGSSLKDVYVAYTILSGSKVLESGTFTLNDEMYTRAFKYKETYLDGITVAYAWVKDGVLHSHNINIRRPDPQLDLHAKWITFRDRLTPGQHETWTLQLTDKDGKPARAQLMATMYDMSLDDIYLHNWETGIRFSWDLASIQWAGTRFDNWQFYGEMPLKLLNVRGFNFTHIGWDIASHLQGKVYGLRGMKKESMSDTVVLAKEEVASNLFGARSSELHEEVVTTGYAPRKKREADMPKPQKSISLRKNFNETAFFFPALQTDSKGNVSLKFTLPESVTTWRLLGYAHDKDMNDALIEATAVAKKSVMIMPNMPRFVRMGDKAVLSNRIVNTTDKPLSAQVEMHLLDPKTEKQLMAETKSITLEANATANANFVFVPSQLRAMGYQGDAVVCRMTIEGKTFSDGEQHLLPILSDMEHVVTTLAFSQHEPGTKTFNIDKLFPVKEDSNKLTVSYTNNPAWMMVEALPTVAHASTKDAISLAAKYYANTLSAYLMQLAGQTDSLEAANRYKEEALFGLRQLQRADGSFSWWPGMSGSLYMTVAVTEMLQRLNMMTGEQQATRNLIANSMKFMAKEVKKDVVRLKAWEAKGYKNLLPSETDLQYLYICALRKENLDNADNKYLLNLVEKRHTLFTIYGKAMMAVILGRNGYNMKLAQEHLKSLKEYTVYTDEMGRYFDTKRAGYSWFDYRIPTEVAAIEALKIITPNDKQTISEMQRWLLQSKRTQSWDTPINCVDAVYAFMQGETKESLTNYGNNTLLTLNGEKICTTEPTAGRAVVKAEKTGKTFGTLTAEKQSNNISWGAIYAEYDQKLKDIDSQATQLAVTRQLINADGKMAKINQEFKVGDKIKVRITLKADRDYDFVEVEDKRPACLEPVDQTSGYNFRYYYAPGDRATRYYFDRLPKGTHIIETEYYIDREGSYSSGICTARCTYSPEFAGRDKAIQLNNEK